jgi:hypothetical protein
VFQVLWQECVSFALSVRRPDRVGFRLVYSMIGVSWRIASLAVAPEIL